MEAAKPLKYFDVYTKQPGEDARAGISHSLSKIQLVPKGSRHSSRQSSRQRAADRSGSQAQKLSQSDASTAIDRAVPLSSSSKTPLTAETLAQHTAMLPADDIILPPLSKMEEPVRIPEQTASPDGNQLKNSPHARASEGASLPPMLAVPATFDIFAGPSSPVSAESLRNLAVSETQMDLHLSNLLTPSSSQVSVRVSSRDGRQLGKSASTPAYNDKCNVHSMQRPSRSNTDMSLRTTSSISETTARCFAKKAELGSHSLQATSIPSIDDLVRQHRAAVLAAPPPRSFASASSPPVPTIPIKFRSEGQRILSIDEIIQRNKSVTALPIRKVAQSAAPALATVNRSSRSRTATENSESSQARSSIDSITGEILQSIQQQNASRPLKTLLHARSQPSLSASSQVQRRDRQDSENIDTPSDSISQSFPPAYDKSRSVRGAPTSNEEITQYIRSARLTRLLTLRRPPNHHLVVSLADVGCDNGHPVVVFLGLGSVRYLVALYDELAESLGLRLICIDRWGLGKTGDVPDTRRGFAEWATVVEEVLDQLDVGKFSIIAHSAGAPYALASALRLSQRVHGSVQLLAPWVGSASESTSTGYKWLKFVPSGVIKTAQAAEWKVQGWRLGKMPKTQTQGVGFNPRAPLSSESTASSPVFAEFAVDHGNDNENESELSQEIATSVSTSNASDREQPYERSISTSFLSTPTQDRIRKTSLDRTTELPSFPRTETPPSRLMRKTSTSSRATSAVSPSIKSQTSTPKTAATLDLGTSLMRASHAESLRGGTSDLLTILQKTSKLSDFAYADITRPVRVWHGLKDDKISLNSVMELENLMPDCKVNIIPGADHSLMTNVAVFVQVLRTIAGEWDLNSRL